MAKKTEKDRKKQKKLDKLNAPSQSDEKVCREGTDLLEIHVRWCAHPSRNRLISPVHAFVTNVDMQEVGGYRGVVHVVAPE